MKREARVLVTACVNRLCAGVVIRQLSVDGVVVSLEMCPGLCKRLEQTGYLYELRYAIGVCGCGLPFISDERVLSKYRWALDFAESLAVNLERLAGEVKAASDTEFKA